MLARDLIKCLVNLLKTQECSIQEQTAVKRRLNCQLRQITPTEGHGKHFSSRYG